MGKDLIDDRFGRFRELPLELARLGHEVHGIALSYGRRPEGTFPDKEDSFSSGVIWNSVNLMNGCLPQIERYTKRALQISREFRPDIIWTCSDAYHAIFGRWLSNRIEARCVIDLYDNFEAFTASRFPGVLPFFRSAVKSADGVTAFSERMADYVMRTSKRSKPTAVVENGVRKDVFQPRDQKACRQQLGLPQKATIIGSAGALDNSRGIGTLFDAFKILSRKATDIHLALAGPRQCGLEIPTGSRVHDFRELPHERVASLINALDIAVVCYRQSAQGEVSFPQKVYEIIACGIPLVAAAVGSMNEFLQSYPQCLYEPEDAASLGNAIQRQLRAKTIIRIPTPTWGESAKHLGDFFLQIIHDVRASS